jgi:ABC-type multidrug transport system fused ATPase/permease subunit
MRVSKMVSEREEQVNGGRVKLMKGFKPISPEYKRIAKKDVVREFWSIAKTHRNSLILMIAFMVIQGVVVSGSIWMVKTSLDLYFNVGDSSSVIFLVASLFLATVGRSGTEFLFNWKRALMVGRISDVLVVRAFRDLVYNPFHVHIKERARRKYGWVLTDARNFVDSMFGIFNSWVKQPFVVLSTTIALLIITPRFTLVGIALIPLCLPCLVFLRRRIKEFIAQREHLIGMVEEVVSESIRGIRIVKAFGLEDNEVRKLEDTVDQQRDLSMKNAFYTGLIPPIAELVGLIGLTVIIVLGSQHIHSGSFTTGTFFVFIMSFANIYRPMKDIANGMLNYHSALDAGRRLIILRENAAKEQARRGTVQLDQFRELRVDDVSFSYAASDESESHQVLQSLSLKIKRGETVAIAGATGAGKSTLCDLLFRLHQHQSGSISVNGVEIEAIENQCFRTLFALCSQDTIVFNNTLLEDIRIARPDVSREEVMKVAEEVGLSSFLDSLNRGLDTWIGDRGVQCSGGQRQMIALARALIQEPEVLVLDEAISGIDVESGERLWRNIRKRLPECTIIMISHHLHIIRRCDRVLVLKDGGLSRDVPMEEIGDPELFFREFHKPDSGFQREDKR